MLYNFNPNSSAGNSPLISQSTPPTGVQANQLWFNTNARCLFFWNGSHWISEKVYRLHSTAQNLAANTNVYISPGRIAFSSELGVSNNYEFVITQQSIVGYFSGVLADANNYWTLTTSAMNNSQQQRNLTTINLTGAANTWIQFTNTGSSYMGVVNISDPLVFNQLSKVGTPGNIFFSCATLLRMRLI